MKNKDGLGKYKIDYIQRNRRKGEIRLCLMVKIREGLNCVSGKKM